MNQPAHWDRFRRNLCECSEIGLRLDYSRMNFDPQFLERMSDAVRDALRAMTAIEQGAKANIDEGRMVGHYWLRAPHLAPQDSIKKEIETVIRTIRSFAAGIHDGTIKPQRGDAFLIVLVIGIGGSALGPQLLADALGNVDDPVVLRFMDNTDPEGIQRLLAELNESLGEALTIVVSKSGGTVETRNAMAAVSAAYEKSGLSFARHAVAITQAGNSLHNQAAQQQWLATFPIWDWVGGRTSITSAVGLLPAALLGVDIEGFLAGAAACDRITRNENISDNPAALLALMWHYAGGGRGDRNLVILPYADRLALLGRYLQQLVMESLGKECDRKGNIVHQGLTVFGNKGSTDQHAFVQQLRDGRNDFFVTFVNVLRWARPYLSDRSSLEDRHSSRSEAPQPPPDAPEIIAADSLHAFLHGTRDALTEKGRESITITFDELNAHRLGALIALLERAVGLYAELIDVNAYHQPGVEAGKTSAAAMIALQRRVLEHLRTKSGQAFTAEQIADALHEPAAVESIFHFLEHAAANRIHSVHRIRAPHPADFKFAIADA